MSPVQEYRCASEITNINGLAKSAYVLEGGHIRYRGTAQELKEKPELLHSAYLLREHSETEIEQASS